MDVLSARISSNPLLYLPEESLTLFSYFREGYDLRYVMSNKSYLWSDDKHKRLFAQWVRRHFNLVGGRALSHFGLIASFSANEVDAFRKYFNLLEEFCRQHPSPPPSESYSVKSLDFLELLKAVRKQPAEHLADRSFLGYCAFLMGEQHAYNDLGFPPEGSRMIFEGFKSWVEEKKNRALPRSWFNIITFWSGSYHCAHVPYGAFSVYYKWLDEYANEIGKPGLFSIL